MSDTDIKMSDVFDLPVITDYSGVIFDDYCCAIGEVCGTLDQSRLVSHAINSYDALIEQNKSLRAALSKIAGIESSCTSLAMEYPIAKKIADKALKQSK